MYMYFAEEHRCLSLKRLVPAESSILSLNPFLDQKGLIRTCGRVMAFESLRYNERHPIFLPYECLLLVKFTYLIALHGGTSHPVQILRSDKRELGEGSDLLL